MSPILTFSPDMRQVHQEHVESSEPIGNNDAVIEVLNGMRKKFQESDNQLKV